MAVFKNFSISTLASGITAAATSLSVGSGHGARFPTTADGDFYIAVYDPDDPGGTGEVMECTARSTDTLTVTRGVDGTTGVTHDAGEIVELVAPATIIRQLPENSWLANLFQRPTTETVHADDDEFDTDTSSSWTEIDISGENTQVLTWGGHVLSFLHPYGSGVGGDFQGVLKSLGSLTSPLTIETCFESYISIGNGHGTALIGFTDGTGSSANSCFTCWVGNVDTRINSGTLGSVDTTVDAGMDNSLESVPHSRLYLRSIWASSNTFKAQFSIDGVSWDDFDIGSVSKTMTPTHFGIGFMNWGLNYAACLGKFEYFRVTESDLS